MGHSGSYLIGESSGDHTMSSTASASTSQLPSRHPLLMHQEVPQEHTTPLGFAAHREATSAATASQSLPVLDHSENTIPQSSSALAQLLSTSSAHDVLRLNRSGLSGTQTATTTGGQDLSHADTEDPGNQTSIPSTYSRWSEECEALDGSIQHLCINCIKPTIITSLEQTLDKEKRKVEEKEDDKGQSNTATTDSTATSSSLERAVRNRIATAAANVNSAIDNLHASLQSVASSLAGTVEMVRSGLNSTAATTSTPSNRGQVDQGGSEEQESDRNELPLPPTTEDSTTQQSSVEPPPLLVPFTETQPITSSATSTCDTVTTPTVQSSATPTSQPIPTPSMPSSATPTLQPLPTPTVQPSTTPIAPPSVTSVPPLTTPTVSFDGSQASAAAMLQNTDPTDPMYMFLSAVAGAPAPPLPESSSATTAPPTQEMSEDEVLQRRGTSDALRIASRIAELFQSDALPLPGDDNDENDDQDNEDVTGVTTQTASSLASSLAASLVQSLTTGNSTSPCTSLAPQLSNSLQVHRAVDESSQSGQSEMVGDIIPLLPNQQSATTATTSNSATSGTATTDVLSSMPEELDSTFLEALPESIREELVSQHAAEMRRRQMQSETRSSGDNFVSTISPEFLAALPPNIQEEVS